MIRPNSIEKYCEVYLESSFSNYISFRDKYLIPLTGYPNNPNWRIDTHPNLERIGITSYAILKSIAFILQRKDKIAISDLDQSFKNIYFHFGHIFDCVETLSRYIILTENLIGISNTQESMKLSKKELLKGYEEWVDKDYHKRFEAMKSYGKPIMYYPQRDHTFLSLIIKNPIKREYNKFAKLIKDYRNYFIHNPGVDVFKETATERLFALKKEYVDLSINWSNIQFHFDTEKEYFEEPLDMINRDLEKLTLLLNEIWNNFSKRLNQIFSSDDFYEIFQNYNRELEF